MRDLTVGENKCGLVGVGHTCRVTVGSCIAILWIELVCELAKLYAFLKNSLLLSGALAVNRNQANCVILPANAVWRNG